MRRIKILFFWLFINKNNVSIKELLQFLIKPNINTLSKKYINSIEEKNKEIEISFKNIKDILYWPKNFTIQRFKQVVCETFDSKDWHYYQKKHTEIDKGEILLDIGTAEGLFPLSVIDNCEHIYMIEPSNSFYDCLNKTFYKYSKKTTIFNTAVGNENGIVTFDENSIEGMISNKEGNKIDITKIDTLLKDKKITYLKADIEGYEQEMLKGAEQTIKKNKPKIAITTYHTENNPVEIIKLIKSYVPEYHHYYKGIYEETPKPVMIHFWI